jgi:hypothetical protein
VLTLFKEKSLDERKPLVKAMVARMAQAYAIKKSGLPEQLNCSKGLVNNWSYYGRIPYDYLEQCRLDTGVSLDWLMYGVTPVKSLTAQDVAELNEVHVKVLGDGVNYAMISECYEGAITQLTAKYEKDIDSWVEQLNAKKPAVSTGDKND